MDQSILQMSPERCIINVSAPSDKSVMQPREVHKISVFRRGQMVIVAYWKLQLLEQSLEVMQLASTSPYN